MTNYLDLPPIARMPVDVLVGDWYVALTSEWSQQGSRIGVVPRQDDLRAFDVVQTYLAPPSTAPPPQAITYSLLLRSPNRYGYTSSGFSGELLVLSGHRGSHLLVGSRSAKHSQLSVISRSPRLTSTVCDAVKDDCLHLGIDYVKCLERVEQPRDPGIS
ncbi:hypothetical protein [Streptomyces sp. NPDC047108]|uniref:hypothetical protein n=1 Tax=Streptomyces sp. NPDC047108 TaxID=3155025 RepID=UPI0033D7A5D1